MTDADRIARALLTRGGHLAIGRGGSTLHHDDARVSHGICDELKRAAIEAGLPVIDTRTVPFEIALRLAVHGPLVGVNHHGDDHPWHGFGVVPLAVLATVCRQVGADVHNIEDDLHTVRWFADRSLVPLGELIDGWLVHVLGSAEAASAVVEEVSP